MLSAVLGQRAVEMSILIKAFVRPAGSGRAMAKSLERYGQLSRWWCAGARRALRVDRRIHAARRNAHSGGNGASFGATAGSLAASASERTCHAASIASWPPCSAGATDLLAASPRRRSAGCTRRARRRGTKTFPAADMQAYDPGLYPSGSPRRTKPSRGPRGGIRRRPAQSGRRFSARGRSSRWPRKRFWRIARSNYMILMTGSAGGRYGWKRERLDRRARGRLLVFGCEIRRLLTDAPPLKRVCQQMLILLISR